jgi:hypothetical protein
MTMLRVGIDDHCATFLQTQKCPYNEKSKTIHLLKLYQWIIVVA